MESGREGGDVLLKSIAPPSEKALNQQEGESLDDVIQKIGPFGLSQIKVYVLTSLFDFALAFQLFFFLFGGGNPGWYCIPADDGIFNSTGHSAADVAAGAGGHMAIVNYTIPNGIFREPTRKSVAVLEEWENQCFVNGSKCSQIIFKPGYTSIVTEFSLVCDLSYVSTFCTTMVMVGILGGAALGGHLSDLIGRRPVLYGLALVMDACGLVQSFSTSWQMFAAIRFVAGLTLGGFMVVGYIVPLEVVGMQWRTVCGCIGFFQLAQVVFAGIAVLITQWRDLSMVTTLICVPLLLTYFFVPESPRWLIQKGKVAEATKILNKMAKLNGRPPPSEEDIRKVKKQDDHHAKYYTLDLFSTAEYGKRSLVMFFLWFSCTMSYYGLSINGRDIADDIYINVFIMGALELVFTISVIFSAYKFGRKPAILFYYTITCSCLISALTLNITKTSAIAQSILGSLGRASLSAAWTIAYLLSAELFPTVIRAVAAGSCSVAGRIGGILAPQVAYLRIVHPAIPGSIYASFAVIATLLAFFLLPETKGTVLRDTLPKRRGFCCTRDDDDSQSEVKQELKNYDPTCV